MSACLTINHMLMSCQPNNLTSPTAKFEKVSLRSRKIVNFEAFRNELRESALCNCDADTRHSNDIDKLINQFNVIMAKLLDDFLLVTQFTIR